jgi:hypothetical protein
MSDVEVAIARFLAKYSADVARDAKAARAKLRKRIPYGFELVYDNYNALAIGFGPSERPSELVISIAVYPKWVTLFFLRGAKLADPRKLLTGSGARVRSIRLAKPADLDSPAIVGLIGRALVPHAKAFAAAPKLSTSVRSISAKQRPRRAKSAKRA